MTNRFTLWGILLFLALAVQAIGHAQGTPAPAQATPEFTIKPIGFAELNFEDMEGEGSRFRVNRMRLGVAGKYHEFGYTFLYGAIEPPDRDPALVDAYVEYPAIDQKLIVRGGQFLAPFGLEGPESIVLNPAIERSIVSRQLNPFTMFRDIGVGARGNFAKAGYAVAVVNGAGANVSDDNDEKDVLGRVYAIPVENLTFGVSAHAGSVSNADLDRTRFGVDAEYRNAGTIIRGEYITREDDLIGGDTLERAGWYMLVALRLDDHWEPVVRYARLDPNADIDNDALDVLTLGVNYYFFDRTRFSVNYEFADDAVGDQLIAQMQFVL